MVESGRSTRVKGIRFPGPPYGREVVEDEVALEAPVNIYVNDKELITLFASPHDLEELAIGHLIGEGIVRSASDVERVVVDGLDVLVYVREDDGLDQRVEEHRKIRLIYSSCGSVNDFIRALDALSKPRVSSDFKISVERLHRLVNEFARNARHTISVHTAAIYDGISDRFAGFVEDVSRHVTVDRAVGRLVLERLDPSRAVLVTTGRQASDMVLKAARVGIPVTVSLRGPLFSGIYAAMRTGITLVSLVRGKGLTVYTHPDRVLTESQQQELRVEGEDV